MQHIVTLALFSDWVPSVRQVCLGVVFGKARIMGSSQFALPIFMSRQCLLVSKSVLVII